MIYGPLESAYRLLLGALPCIVLAFATPAAAAPPKRPPAHATKTAKTVPAKAVKTTTPKSNPVAKARKAKTAKPTKPAKPKAPKAPKPAKPAHAAPRAPKAPQTKTQKPHRGAITSFSPRARRSSPAAAPRA